MSLRQIRDPVHGLIRFSNKSSDLAISNLLNAKEFQRLRRIRQLGFSEFTFPGATHSRFSHSLGVMHNARRFVEHLQTIDPDLVPERDEIAIVAAALLHDIGHGPFSHAFERVSGESHESRTVEILLDPNTDIHARLIAIDSELPAHIAAFFPEESVHFKYLDKHKVAELISSIPHYQRSIVSSQLDADRFDYLARDSHFCGVGYGAFDLNWILSDLVIDDEHRRLACTEKGLHAVEAYVFARYHMYQAVYFHKATRAAEAMLIAAFQHAQASLASGTDAAQLLPGAPLELVESLRGERLELGNFLSLDDYAASRFVYSCSRSSSKTLAMLGEGLLRRQLFKSVTLPESANEDMAGTVEAISEAGQAVKAWAETNSFDPAACWRSDTMKNTPYSIYNPDDEASENTQIYIKSGKTFVELSRRSKLVETLKSRVVTTRYHFPEECREALGEKFPLLVGRLS